MTAAIDLDAEVHAWILIYVRAFWAFLAMICVGISLPAGITHARVCLLEETIVQAQPGDDCCEACEKKSTPHPPCCVEISPLPDSSAPVPCFHCPPARLFEIPSFLEDELQPDLVPPPSVVKQTHPAGTGPPGAHRAEWGVWRL